MEYNPHRRLYNSTYSIALFIFGIILFWEVLGHNFFIFDDSAHIFENPLISSFSLKSLISLWKNSFIAMTYSLWGTISYFFGSKNTMAFHAVNIFFHCINSVLCFYLIKRVLEVYYGKNIQYLQEISFFSALIFLVHPLKV